MRMGILVCWVKLLVLSKVENVMFGLLEKIGWIFGNLKIIEVKLNIYQEVVNET